MTDVVCGECGARKIEYQHRFCKGLAVFLLKLYEVNGPAKTDDLGLTYSQRTNSQKLRYWELAAPYAGGENSAKGKRKRGWWQITDKGRLFVEGRVWIAKGVVMKNNKRVRYEGEEIRFHEVCEGYQYHGDFQDQAHEQIMMF